MKLQITIDSALSASSQRELIGRAIAEFLQFDDETIRASYAKVGTSFGSVELINPHYSEKSIDEAKLLNWCIKQQVVKLENAHTLSDIHQKTLHDLNELYKRYPVHLH